jgi:release factor glutamine methyltransferase
VVELGPGSGVIIAFLTAHAHTIFGTDILSLSIDVNPLACLATRTTVGKALDETNPPSLETSNGSNTVPVQEPAKNNSIYLSSFQADLTTPILHDQVDILIFNPPYVPTESVPSFPPRATASETSLTNTKPTFDESSHLLSLSYAGGQDGMEVTNRVLAQIPETLSQRGVAYILFCRGNKPEEVKAGVRAWEGGWCAETVGNSGKTAGWERLEIVRIWRGRNGS